MIITIRNKWVLRIFWRRMNVPPYVTASHDQWIRWLRIGVPVSKKFKETDRG